MCCVKSIWHKKTHVSKKRHNTTQHKMTQKDTKKLKKKFFFSEIWFFNHSLTESCSAHYELSVHTFDAQFEFSKIIFFNYLKIYIFYFCVLLCCVVSCRFVSCCVFLCRVVSFRLDSLVPPSSLSNSHESLTAIENI